MTSTPTRQTAAERREAVLDAALRAFAAGGLHGTSTEDIAREAGISQPYLFRLFGTKKKLFVATVERCMQETLELFRDAAGDLRGEEALQAMGDAYAAMVTHDRTRLLAQLQAYAACGDTDVRESMRQGYGRLHLFVETVSGLPPQAVSAWFSRGMLLNVVAAMDLWDLDEPWVRRLLEGSLGSDRPAVKGRTQ
ncbi:MAG TPA: TetR/AcrR family transcriptional regulator [Gaiellaceae bacterium]|jgi:AcrR family transcriptional regulator|nr:TetR/AcrR family transcriptional regulator [Gaiellaceae bacterium]